MRVIVVFLALILLSDCAPEKRKKKEFKDNELSADGSKLVQSKYDNGKTKAEITYKNGKQNGIAKSFDRDGHLLLELFYIDNKRAGLSKKYYAGGKQIYQSTEYKDDKMHGRQTKFRENGNLMSEARFENNFPCIGLNEYLLDNTLKKKYPHINIRTIDKLESSGVYILEISMSDKIKSVKYYSGKLTPTGCIHDDLYFILQDPGKKTGQLKYNLPPGGFMMEELNIVAVVETLLGNSYVTQRSYNLAIDN
jgi:hypothetical protein